MIVFLLLSKNNDVLLEAADELIGEFQGQFVCIAEDENIAETWKAELIKRNTADEETLNELTVVGLPWAHVQSIITDLTGSDRDFSATLQLPSSLGTPIILPEKAKKDLSDLEILGSNMCTTEEARLEDKQELHKFVQDAEDRFYRGGQVSWWNFYFKTHVLKRDKHTDLMEYIKNALQGVQGERSYDENVRRVALYHQPGAGGTTTARHILWDLKQEFRCAIIKTLTNQTCSQILRLRAFGEPVKQKPKPVLVMVDNLDEEKVLHLFAELAEKAKHLNRDTDDPFDVICVFLNVLRRSKVPNIAHQKFYERVILKQELSSPEQVLVHRQSHFYELHMFLLFACGSYAETCLAQYSC